MKTKFLQRVVWLMIPLLTVINSHVLADTYALVTDASTLASGDEIIIVNTGGTKALSTTQNSNNRGAADVTVSNSKITPSASVQVITLGTRVINYETYWTFSVGSNKWLYAASSSSNHLKEQTTLDNNGSWSITLNSSSEATIQARGSNSHNLLKYNSGSTIFSCYTGGQVAIKIYKKEVASCTLSSISLNTTSVQKTFCVGETFNSTGLVTTASYSGGCADKAVTPASVSVPSGAMNSAGSKTVTVSYTEGGVTKTATYTITVQAKYTVTWMVNGSSYSTGNPDTQVCPGSHVTNLPTAPSTATYCGEVFAGWTDAEYSGNNPPTHLYKQASDFPNATGNQIFYAVFADYEN